MGYFKYFITILIGIFFSTLVSASNDKMGKVLIISSYGPDYQWSNSIIDSIGIVINKFNSRVELNIEYISSEMFVDSQSWVNKVNLLLDNYKNVKPLAIVLVSDEAWMAYREAKTKPFADVPLFLCAVKPNSIRLSDYVANKDHLTLDDFHPTTDAMRDYNASGVLREMNVVKYFELMNNVIAGINSYTFVTDSRFYGLYTRIIIEDYLEREANVLPVEFLDARFINTDSLLRALRHISPKTGLLLTSWLTGVVGFEYSKTYVYNEMAKLVKTPIFITNDIGLASGHFFGGYLNDAGFWGDAVGALVVQSLAGMPMSRIYTKIFRDTQCQVNWDVKQRFNISSDVLPEKGLTFVSHPESLMQRYRNVMVSVIVILLFIAIVCAFIIKSNINLKRARDIAHRAINETKAINSNLIQTHNNLEIALTRAERADKLKSAFISSMDREIRTPLNTIVGFASIISSMEDKNEIEQAATHIEQNSQRLLEVVQSIIDLSKIESGQVEFLCSNLNLTGVLLDIVTRHKTHLRAGLDIIFTPAATPVTLYSDSYRLTQVVSALVDNAVKFTSSGVIEVGYVVEQDVVEIFVKDNGVGIAAGHLDYIFEHFYKVDAYQMGSGLGLSIAKKIVEILHGEIGVSSVVGQGSRFWVRFNVVQ